MNVKLLRQIQRRIKKEPRQFIMSGFFFSEASIPHCHTAACIAGWAVTLAMTKTKRLSDALKDFRGSSCILPAIRALGLSANQANDLFYELNWPLKFKGEGKTLAKRAIARIEHMIKTGE